MKTLLNMRVLFFVAVIAGSTFAATIPPQIDSNNVFEMSGTPVSDTFDVIYNQARSAVVGLFNLLTIPFEILSNSQQMQPIMSNEARSVDPLRGVFQATNSALQRASDSINTVLTNNAPDANSDPLLQIFQKVIGKRAQMVEGVNETVTGSKMQSLPILQRLLTFGDHVNSK